MTQVGTKSYKLLPAVTGFFVSTLLISNTIEPKILDIFGLDVAAGTIIFPLAFVFGDLLTEVYGYAVARRTIWVGFASLIFMALAYEMARFLPAVSYWEGQAAFDMVFAQVPRFVLASIAAYFCGEFMNSYVLARMKVAMRGAHIGFRFVLSTVVGQAVDTTIFTVIAFAGTLALPKMIPIIASGWLLKVMWEVLALPVTLKIVKYVKTIENVDVFDTRTDFNPFYLSDAKVSRQSAQ